MNSGVQPYQSLAPLGHTEILSYLPHRDPFLMVDRILSIHLPSDQLALDSASLVGAAVVGEKDVRAEEPHFRGHFPNSPIMPGVLVVETMAQVACFVAYPFYQARQEPKKKSIVCVLVGIDGIRFRKPVVPGDVLRLDCELKRMRGMMLGFSCRASVDGKPVAEGEILAQITV